VSLEAARAERTRVLVALLLIQVFFGVHYLAGKIVLAAIPPRAWAPLRVASAALVLLGIVAATGRRFPAAPRDWARLALFSVFGVAINQVFFVEGLARTTATHSAIINTLIPAWTLLFAVLLAHERLTALKGASLALAVAGVLLVIRPERASFSSTTFVGDLLTIANSLSYGLFLVISKRTMHRVDAVAATALMFAFATPPIAAYGGKALASLDPGSVPAAVWAWAAFIVLVPTAGAYVLISWTLARAEASLVAMFVYVQPVIAAILGVVFQGESLTIRTVVGALVIFAAVYLAMGLPRPSRARFASAARSRP